MIYWSITLGFFFAGAIVSFENTYIYWLSLLIWGICLIFIWLQTKRVIMINSHQLEVKAIYPPNTYVVTLDQIKEICLAENGILIITTEHTKKHYLFSKKISRRFLKEQQNNPLLREKIRTVKKIDFTLSE